MDTNTIDEPDTRPDWLKNSTFMPSKLRDRRAAGWVKKPGQGWVYDPDYQPQTVVTPKPPEPAQQVVSVRPRGDHLFKPGNKAGVGNGRPKGSKNKLRQKLLDNVDGILDVMVAQAMAGDAQAAALVVNRCLPTLRPQSELVTFVLDVDQSISKQVEQVLLATSRGEVAADVAKKIVETITSLANIRATEELAKRIEALEARTL